MLSARLHVAPRSGYRSLVVDGAVPDALLQHPATQRNRTTDAVELPATATAARVVELCGGGGGLQLDPGATDLLRAWHATQALLRSFRGNDGATLDPLPFATDEPPWGHQLEAYHLATTSPGCLLHYGMGTGKTRITLDVIRGLGARRVLVGCPKAVVRDGWLAEATRRHPDFQILALDKGSARKRQRQAADALDRASARTVLVVINWDALRSADFGEWALTVPWDLVVADEVQCLKAAGSKTSRYMARLARRVPRRLGLSGTPTPQGPHEAYGVFRFIDPALFGSSHTVFRARYCLTSGDTSGRIVGYQRSAELRKLYYSATHRRDRDVLDLPEVQHLERRATLPGPARALYRELAAELVAEIEGGRVTAQNALSKSGKLRQICCGHVRTDDGVWRSVHTAKETLLAEVFDELALDAPVVVFAVFRRDLEAIHRVARRSGRASLELSGERNDLAAWRSGAAPVLAVQIQSGGVGVDLSRAATAVYYSQTWSLGQYEQSLARIHRPGQRNRCLYVHLVVAGTVEPRIYRAHQTRRDAIETVLADPRALLSGE